jgi:hypothetical protein
MKKIFTVIFTLAMGVLVLNSCKKDINPATGTLNPFAPLFAVKNIYKDAEVKLTAELLSGATSTTGVVVAGSESTNLPAGAFVMQNSSRGLTRGIVVNMGSETVPYVAGDSLVLDLQTATLTKVGGSIQLKGISAGNIRKVSSGNVIVPKSVSLGVLNASYGVYENTVIKVTADTKPLPATGDVYAGSKTLDDGSGTVFTLYTQQNAAFSANAMPASASYTVIPVYGNETGGYGNQPQLRIRTIADVENASGPIYANWPESFESPDATVKPSYNMNTVAVPNNNVDMKTGNWKLEQAILGNLNANRDRYNAPGSQCIRMQQNLSVPGYIQMNFDLDNGASKVTFWQGAYSTDVSSTFRLEYSVDSGVSWVAAGPDYKTATGGSKQETVSLNIKGKVRFRIVKLGLGASSVPTVLNGRLCIEDIAIYSN